MSSTNLRAAAFLAEQQRLDFRRGGSTVRCKPPNRACGDRCIPPNWDCRLKGEGNDPHLKAAGRGTDIVSGFASLQRGLTGIGKGVTKLSFSEVESGRRALARGTAKLHPGDLKKKEEAKKAVYNTALFVLTPVVLGITAALGHRGLKSFSAYREGVGRDIDNTFREVTDRIARNTPGIGQGIRDREAAGRRGLQSVRRSQQGIAETLRSRTTTGTRTLQVASSRRSTGAGQRTIQAALDQVNRTPGVTSNYLGVEEWYDRSLKAFWGVKRSKSLQDIAGVGEGSLYSIDSTNTLLARSLELRNSNNQPLNLRGIDLEAEASQVRNLIASRIKAERDNIAIGMRQARLDPKDATSVQQYLQSTQAEWQTGNVAVDEEISRSIVNIMSGKTADSKIADEMYRRTVNKFDVYYDDIRDLVANPPGIGSGMTRRRQLYQDAVRGHTQYLARTIDFSFGVNGPGMTALLKKAYHKRRVQTQNGRTARGLSLTNTELANVASELGIDIRTKPAPELEALINERMRELVPLPGKPNAEPLITVRRVQVPAEEARARPPRPAAATEAGATEGAPTPTPEGGRPARRYRPNEQQIYRRFINANYSEEEARAKAAQYIAERTAREAARKARGDAPERGDSLDTWTARDDAHLETWIRLDKRCGKSGIPQNRKCSKTTPPQSEKSQARERGKAPGLTCSPPNKQCGESCIPPTETCEKTSPRGGKALQTAAQIATIAGGAAAVVGAVRNRRGIAPAVRGGASRARAGLRTGTLRVRRNLRSNNRELYRNTFGRARVARRVTGATIRTQTDATISSLSQKTIKALSADRVDQGINRLPKQYQAQARELIGGAKVSAAHLALTAKGGRITSVNTKDNFSNWRMKDGTLLSTGSVGDSLVIYNTRPQESIGGAQTFSTQFRIDGEFDAKSTSASRNARGVVTTVKKMFQSQVDELPDNSIVYAIPYSGDTKGGQRRSIYEKYGFRAALSSDERLFAMKTKGRFTRMNDNHIEQIADLIRNDSFKYDFDDLRIDKRCGKSGIPNNRKCSKTTTASAVAAPATTPRRTAAPPSPAAVRRAPGPQSTKQQPENQTQENIKKAAIVAGGITAALFLGKLGIKKAQIDAYRRNVAESAIKAEGLAKDMERDFREKAAARLGKKVQDVDGFEASVYNFKDKGYDRGFGSLDNNPDFFGQTKNSRGAVVMLAYADDNKFTTRGQGGYKMVQGGAFKQIWGDRDIMPYANNISQPETPGLDDLKIKAREQFGERVAKVAGERGRKVTKIGFAMKDNLERFAYLRKNVNERGFNPDAVRVAAFVAAQRRLTGKSVDIMSYSNGGNVATEALAILKEMGYRDVKVVNIAGPTFGMFSHSKDNMRTWVSRGDEFFSTFGENGFKGSNPRIIDNDNIPHGLTEKIDRNNREYGANWRENLKAKNSYLLDEQVQREAYKFLTVDRKRSGELLSEAVYNISENRKFSGDLQALFGDESDAVLSTYAKALTGKNAEAAKEQLRDQIEDQMLAKWYGGYDAKAVGNRSTELRAEVAKQATRQAQPGASGPTAPKPSPLTAKSLAITRLMRQKLPNGRPRYATRRAAEAAYERLMRRSSPTAAA